MALREAAREIEEWAIQHHITLRDQSIGQTAAPGSAPLRALDKSPAEGPTPFGDLLREFEALISPNAFRPNHPRFLAFVPGAPCFPSVLGDWLASSADFFCGNWMEASAPAQIESTVIDWFRQWLGMPKTTRGLLTSGGSEANLTALVVARERLSFEDRRRSVLYVAEQRHSSIDRAAKVMGIHPSQVCPVATDEQFRLPGSALADAVARDRQAGLQPWAVVANAGATNTGTVDALEEVADVCGVEGLWFHVDAAYGWVAALNSEGRDALSGIERADSVTIDPHKWLAQTFESGCVLVRNGRLLPQTFTARPEYLQDVTDHEGEVNYSDYGISLTRRFRALKIWLSVRMLGLDWFRKLASHCCTLAEYAEVRLAATGCFEILCSRQLSIVCFRYAASRGDLNELNRQLAEALRQTGRAFLSSTRLRGVYVLRMCFVNWRTCAADVDEIVDLLVRLGSEIATGRIVPTFPPAPLAPATGSE
jgi:glutamate/tyrosine decarboxylase-like PLP-dependent enzyme